MASPNTSLSPQFGRSKGVVDIGSNGIRLLIGAVSASGQIKRLVKQRVSIRLGQDVFQNQSISRSSLERTTEAFLRFNREFSKHSVDKVRVVATSAVREADNRAQFVSHIREKTGLQVEVIDFREEAQLILNAVVTALPIQDRPFLLMDIGGGSVELILADRGKLKEVISLPLGTVRLLKGTSSSKALRAELESQISKQIPKVRRLIQSARRPIQFFIGTGGNMECLGDLRKFLLKKEAHTKIRSHELDYVVEELFLLSTEERIDKLNLRPDRADVILPASLLTQAVLKRLDLNQVILPGVGLREGVLLHLK